MYETRNTEVVYFNHFQLVLEVHLKMVILRFISVALLLSAAVISNIHGRPNLFALFFFRYYIISISCEPGAHGAYPKGRLLTPAEGCGVSKIRQPRIIGGTPAPIGKLKFRIEQ